jgi:hypothetical protein
MRSIETLIVEGKTEPKRKRRDHFAPVLTALLEDLRDRPALCPGDPSIIRMATEELARLKAVVRAWQREQHIHCSDSTQVARAIEKLIWPASER